jgi:hypothetical protein
LEYAEGIAITLGGSYPLFGFFSNSQITTPSASAVAGLRRGRIGDAAKPLRLFVSYR